MALFYTVTFNNIFFVILLKWILNILVYQVIIKEELGEGELKLKNNNNNKQIKL